MTAETIAAIECVDTGDEPETAVVGTAAGAAAHPEGGLAAVADTAEHPGSGPAVAAGTVAQSTAAGACSATVGPAVPTWDRNSGKFPAELHYHHKHPAAGTD